MVRKAQPKRGTRTRKTRQDSSLIRYLSILLVFVVICAGAYWNQQGGTVTPEAADSKMESIENGKASGKDMDYGDAAQEAQDAIDAWLKSQGHEVIVLDTKSRDTQRKATGGQIRWTTRNSKIIPKGEFSKAALETQLAKSKGKAVLYAAEKDKLDGTTVSRYDIALVDKLDGQPIQLIVTRLYVTPPGAATLIDKVKTLLAPAKKADTKDSGASDKKEPAETVQSNKGATTVTHPDNIKGKLAIVIDDFGYRQDVLGAFNAIPVPLTYSVMPYKEYTATCADSGYNAGRQIMVHMPMKPLNVNSSEAVFIYPEMGNQKIQSTAVEMLNQVPHAIGANNHQGSYTTMDANAMKSVLSVLKKRDLFFLDSRTSGSTVGEKTASSMGVATAMNDLFIDNDSDVESVRGRLRQAGKMALRNGNAIVIGHARPNTAEAIRSMVDELHDDGIDVVFVSQLLQ